MESFETRNHVNIVKFVPGLIDISLKFFDWHIDFRVLDYAQVTHLVTTQSGEEIYKGKSLNDCIQFCDENEYMWEDV